MFLGFLTVYIFVSSSQPIKILMVRDLLQIALCPGNHSSSSYLEIISTSLEFPQALFMALYVQSCLVGKLVFVPEQL